MLFDFGIRESTLGPLKFVPVGAGYGFSKNIIGTNDNINKNNVKLRKNIHTKKN